MSTSYTPLPLTEGTQTPYTYTDDELRMMRRSTAIVIFLCFVQLGIAFGSLLTGGIILMCVTALFVSMGIVGAAKRNVRLVIVHFVYSLVLYILSVVGLVLFIFYSHDINLWFYALSMLLIIIQAVGLRHSRILIGLLRKNSPPCARRCGMWRRGCSNKNACPTNNVQVTVETPAPVPQPTPETPVPVPSAPQMMQPITINGQQYIAVPYSPMMPQYYPLQPMNYPTSQPVFPYFPQPEQQNLYPGQN